MAHFTLSAQTTSGEVLLTLFDTVQGRVSGLTFDESINESIDSTSLTFSALKYRVEGGNQVINLPIMSLSYGTVIIVRERNRIQEFKIQSINYTFLPNNMQLQFNCIDRFQAEATKLAVGYTIQADTSDPNFLGAQSIDTWARKILRETNLPWGYIAIDEANDQLIKQLANASTLQVRDDITDTTNWEAIDEELVNAFKPNPATLNAAVSFECSNVNAYEALKKLASENELILQIDYAGRNIYFIPQKSWWFKGYYLNPNINLQQMGLQGDGQNMITVLNVTGPVDANNQEITLVPSIPEDFENYVSSANWKTSQYFSGFFFEHSKDKKFATMASMCPWFENKLIDISFYRGKLFSAQEENDIQKILTNDLRIINVPLMIATRAHLRNLEKWLMKINTLDNEVEAQIGYVVGALDNLVSDTVAHINNTITTVVLRTNDTLYIPVGDEITMDVEEYDYLHYTSDNGHIIIPVNSFPSSDVTLVFKYRGNILKRLKINAKNNFNITSLDYTVPTINGPIPELDTFLNEKASVLNTAWQTLNKNAVLLRDYWEGDNYRHESFYVRFKKMGVYTQYGETSYDRIMQETLTANESPWSTADSSTLTQDDINALTAYFNPSNPQEPSVIPTRSLVIQECANIATKMTQYWNAMRTAALQQGAFVPSEWDCVDFLLQYPQSTQISSWLYNRLLPLRLDNGHLRINDAYGRSAQLAVEDPIDTYHFRFFDSQRDALNPLVTNDIKYLKTNPAKVIRSNTDNYYERVNYNEETLYPLINFWYYEPRVRRNTTVDTIQLYRTKMKYRENQYCGGYFIPATSACVDNTIITNNYHSYLWGYESNTITSNITTWKMEYYQSLLAAIIEGTTIYSLQRQHDDLWRQLYHQFPGLFAETNYENTDAATTTDLYFAAQAQLAALNKPEFSYNLTGIDIYSREGKLLLWNIGLGDQVRIDYVENARNIQVVDLALQEPLYVTSINHSLRDDANYQFNVATRKATDTMVRRFARLLTLGR